MNIRAWLMWVMTAVLGIALAAGATGVFTRWSSTMARDVLTIAMVLSAMGVSSLVCLFVLSREQLVALMWTGIGSAAAALLSWVVVIWGGWWGCPYNAVRWAQHLAVWGTIFATIVPLIGLVNVQRFDRRAGRIAQVSTTAVLASSGGSIGIVALFRSELALGVMSVFFLLTISGLVGTAILAALEQARRRSWRQTMPRRVLVKLDCPRCGSVQHLGSIRDRCDSCGLRIEIELEEPRCQCGYPLYKLAGGECPECGRAIPAQERWAAAPDL